MPTVPAINHNIMPPQNYPYNEEKKHPRINVKDVLIIQSVPLIAGGGHAVKTYFENKGKVSAYQDLLKSYKAESQQYKNLENRIEFAKKNIKAAKRGGIILVVTMALTSAWIAIANACCKPKKIHLEDYADIAKTNSDSIEKEVANA